MDRRMILSTFGSILFLAISLLIMPLASPVALAQQVDRDTPFYPPAISFDTDIPRPETVIGHPLGHRLTRNDLLIKYMRMLAEISPRIRVEDLAYTHEGRPLLVLTITSPANHSRIEDIRSTHVALSDPDSSQEVSEDMPIVTWLHYGVHGAETSSTDSSMAVAYHLAAAQGAEIENTLNSSVIIMIAVANPDGSSRMSAWNHMHGGNVPISNPEHRLHNTFWPGGRTNHYWFDLNRQWLILQHPEPRGWVEKFHKWKPNIVADYHEMGSASTYYFHPGQPDRNFPLIPAQSMALLDQVADRPRSWLDSEQRLYFHEEGFDNYYIGKGSTYPHMHASMGMLFEQARSIGILDTPHGLLSFRDNTRTQYRTSLEMIRAGVEMRQELLQYQRDFSRETTSLINADDIKAYVFSAPGDNVRAYHALDILNRHQIQVNQLGQDIEIDGQSFVASDSFVVQTDQAQYRMVKGLFEKITEFDDETFYDVSAWTLPLAFDFDYAPLTARELRGGVIGNSINAEFPVAPEPGLASYGYLFDWTNYCAPRALYRLLDAGVRPRVATRPLTISSGGQSVDLPRGAILVSAGWQGGDLEDDELHRLMVRIASEDGVEVHAVDSGRTPMAGMDLGSRNFASIPMPRVLLLTGDGITAYDAGEVWHQLDARMAMPVHMVDKDQLTGLDLDNYTHLLLVGGSHNDMEDHASKIESWVRDGGTFVGIRSGARWGYETILYPDKISETDDMADPDRFDYGDKEDIEAQDIIGGAILAGDLDNTHPIGYGVTDRHLPSHRNTLIAFDPPENPWATVVRIPENALLSGFASDENLAELADKAMTIAERHGDGSVVLFADNPNFRGWFFGTNKLFMNSLFFSRVFESPR
ncbi:MAG: M14 family zinc carboxypeptidase [Gammaproteobacteria bacterium]|nr:M14 family zinc carboxypeptidase [Gammaproteobacteria bacterium]